MNESGNHTAGRRHYSPGMPISCGIQLRLKCFTDSRGQFKGWSHYQATLTRDGVSTVSYTVIGLMRPHATTEATQ